MKGQSEIFFREEEWIVIERKKDKEEGGCCNFLPFGKFIYSNYVNNFHLPYDLYLAGSRSVRTVSYTHLGLIGMNNNLKCNYSQCSL